MGRLSSDVTTMAVEGKLDQEFVAAYHDWTVDRNRWRERPTAQEISCMEHALFWPGTYLRDRVELARALNVCGFAQARGLSVRDVVRPGKHHGVRSPAEWNRLALEAADQIAVGLRIACALMKMSRNVKNLSQMVKRDRTHSLKFSCSFRFGNVNGQPNITKAVADAMGQRGLAGMNMTAKARVFQAKAACCEKWAKKARNPSDREWQLVLARAYRKLAEMETEAAGRRLSLAA
jgi:hypothetical protein